MNGFLDKRGKSGPVDEQALQGLLLEPGRATTEASDDYRVRIRIACDNAAGRVRGGNPDGYRDAPSYHVLYWRDDASNGPGSFALEWIAMEHLPQIGERFSQWIDSVAGTYIPLLDQWDRSDKVQLIEGEHTGYLHPHAWGRPRTEPA